MLKLGIIGYPLKHSLSPSMQGAALQKAGLLGEYVIMETLPEELCGRIDFVKSNNFNGFNVTIPYKTDIIKYIDEIDGFASEVGAVNTVFIDENKRLHGYNTDVYGFINGMPADFRETLSGKRVAVLGCGGAARAVIAGLIKQKVARICIFARDVAKAQLLAEGFAGSCDFSCQKIAYDIVLSEFSLVVNTTPLGMQGNNENISPISLYSCETLEKNALVYDIVYRPQKTKLLEYAEKCGLNCVNGVDMLVFQGVKAFEIWTGVEPSVEVMREALLKSL